LYVTRADALCHNGNDEVESLKKLVITEFPRQAYTYFVSGERPNQSGSEWQFKENLVLEHKGDGTIVMDILKDGRIGGIEMVKYIRH